MPLKASFRAATGKLPHQQRQSEQSAERQRRYSDRRADGRYGRGGFGQKLAHQRGVSAPAPGCHRHRPVGGRRLDALQSRHLHRHHGRRSQSLRQRQQGQPIAVQLQLQRRVRKLPGLGRHLHRPGVAGRGQDALRSLRRQALQGRSAGLQAQRQVDHRRAGDDGAAGAGVLRDQGGRRASCKP